MDRGCRCLCSCLCSCWEKGDDSLIMRSVVREENVVGNGDRLKDAWRAVSRKRLNSVECMYMMACRRRASTKHARENSHAFRGTRSIFRICCECVCSVMTSWE